MAVEKEVQEFSERLESEITQLVFERSFNDKLDCHREQAFTEKVSEYLVEYGATEDVELCYLEKVYGRGNMKVNAYSINETSAKITLLVSVYEPDGVGQTVQKETLRKAIRSAARVFEAACDRFHEEKMEPASDEFSMMQQLVEIASRVKEIHILVLASGVATSQEIDLDVTESANYKLRWQIWDIVRLSRCVSSGRPYEAISIDLEEMPTGPLTCLKMPNVKADYEAYLTIIPGDLLYRLYDEYGPKLLELNVRSYLQAKGAKSVNAGILTTINKEPSRFLAYNNGISATAEKICTKEMPTGRVLITKLEGFQVVNGGQTMASIHRSRREQQRDLDEVFVQAKITLVNANSIEELVTKISRYSNTQNKVNEADFSSNDPFHIEIARLSEKKWCPGEQTRWFYERTRGQYFVTRNRSPRPKQFEAATPPAKKFDKNDMAKYLNTWDMLPHIVSKGGQTNFVHFMSELKKQPAQWLPDEKFYCDLIAKAIIFKKAESIARQHGFPAYRANAITYTVALLSHRTIGRIDLQKIWDDQKVTDALSDVLYEWMPLVMEGIKESAGTRNVTQWCKKEDCWHAIQTLNLAIPDDLQNELAEGQPLPTVGRMAGQRGVGLTHLDRENIAKTMQVKGERWLKIYAMLANEGESFIAPIALTLSGYAAAGWQNVPSAKQAAQAVKMIARANEEGLFADENE